jgi:hypothetical protein
MNLGKIVQGALGLYLILPSVEDWATGGTKIVPSAAIGTYLLLDAFGLKL